MDEYHDRKASSLVSNEACQEQWSVQGTTPREEEALAVCSSEVDVSLQCVESCASCTILTQLQLDRHIGRRGDRESVYDECNKAIL